MASNSQHVKIVVVGDGAVGKTCLLYVYVNNTFPEEYIPTVFDNYFTNVLVDGQTINLGLWDTAGQEDYKRIRPLSYPKSNVILICYSVLNRVSFENVATKWKPEVAHHCPGVPVVLVGTKADLLEDPAMLHQLETKGERPVTAEDAAACQKRVGAAASVLCSAKTNTNVKEVFDTAIRAHLKPKKPHSCGIL